MELSRVSTTALQAMTSETCWNGMVFVADSVKVETSNGTRERVAYDLMQRISISESTTQGSIHQPREYWLTLYAQCLRATNSWDIDRVLDLGK